MCGCVCEREWEKARGATLTSSDSGFQLSKALFNTKVRCVFLRITSFKMELSLLKARGHFK